MRSSRSAILLLAFVAPLALDAQQQKAASPATAPAKSATASATATPTGRAILDRYVKAIGGRDAFLKHNSMRITGTFVMLAAGIDAPLEVFSARPNRMLVKTSIPGMGDMLQGVDGSIAWEMSPTIGPRVLTGRELLQRQRNSDFDAPLHDASRYSAVESIGLTDFQGTPAYKVRLVSTAGDTAFEYFDPTSGLQRGGETTAETPMGRIAVVEITGDYKNFAGFLMPTTVTQKMQTAEVTMKFSNVEFDKVDPSVFELPPAIKTLVGK